MRLEENINLQIKLIPPYRKKTKTYLFHIEHIDSTQLISTDGVHIDLHRAIV